MATIPISSIVSVTPGVQGAGGSALDLCGVFLTNNTRVPVGTAPSFPNLAAVQGYFGAAAIESSLAAEYFAGSTNSTKKPGNVLFYQVNNTLAVPAYLRGSNISTVTPAVLTTGTGVFNITIDGNAFAIPSLTLTGSSYSAIAASLQSALYIAAPAVVTCTASIAGTTMTVSAISSGGNNLAANQSLVQTSGTGLIVPVSIVAQLTGTTGGIGTYTVSSTQTVSSSTIVASVPAPTVTYDVVSGAFVITSGTPGAASSIALATGTSAVKLGLNAGTLSQGAAATSPAVAMAGLLAITTNWAFFTTVFEPNAAGKVAYAQWASSTNYDYAYAMWDTLSTGAVTTGDTTSAYYAIAQAGYSGTVPIYAPLNGALAGAAFMGQVASIDFSAINGRTTSAFEVPAAGITPDVTNGTVAANLQANGYNFYGAWATAASQFNFFYNGSISGKYLWVDSYVNQVWLTNQLQLLLVQLLVQVKSIPYNAAGYAMIEEAIKPAAKAGLAFGAIRTGVILSASEISGINSAAGNINAAATVATSGYYIQVLDPGAQVRVARGSPLCNFWYADGQSVQQINLSSVDVL